MEVLSISSLIKLFILIISSLLEVLLLFFFIDFLNFGIFPSLRRIFKNKLGIISSSYYMGQRQHEG